MLGLILCLSLLYSLPNLFGDDPAVQISMSDRISLSPEAFMNKVDSTLRELAIEPIDVEQSENAIVLLVIQTSKSKHVAVLKQV